jgi:hypothetical protein
METSASFEARSAPWFYPMAISLSGSGEGPGASKRPGLLDNAVCGVGANGRGTRRR